MKREVQPTHLDQQGKPLKTEGYSKAILDMVDKPVDLNQDPKELDKKIIRLSNELRAKIAEENLARQVKERQQKKRRR